MSGETTQALDTILASSTQPEARKNAPSKPQKSYDVRSVNSLLDLVQTIAPKDADIYDLNAIRKDSRIGQAYRSQIAGIQTEQMPRIVLEMIKAGLQPIRQDGSLDATVFREYVNQKKAEPVQPHTEVPTQEKKRLVDRSWSEIREAWLNGKSYAEFFEQAMPLMKPQSFLQIPDTDENNHQMADQIAAASAEAFYNLLGRPDSSPVIKEGSEGFAIKNPDGSIKYDIWRRGNLKLFLTGRKEPHLYSDQDIKTRMYIALDPRHSTNAFASLVKELDSEGVLDGIEAALNIEDLNAKKVTQNGIVLYINQSQNRPEVMDKIMKAYRASKGANPTLYSLTPDQEGAIIQEFATTYKCMVDENLAFVEQTKDDVERSWDAGSMRIIHETINVNGWDIAKPSNEDYLQALKKPLRSSIPSVSSFGARTYILEGKSSLPEGETFIQRNNRNAKVPGLVQLSTTAYKREGNSLKLL